MNEPRRRTAGHVSPRLFESVLKSNPAPLATTPNIFLRFELLVLLLLLLLLLALVDHLPFSQRNRDTDNAANGLQRPFGVVLLLGQAFVPRPRRRSDALLTDRTVNGLKKQNAKTTRASEFTLDNSAKPRQIFSLFVILVRGKGVRWPNTSHGRGIPPKRHRGLRARVQTFCHTFRSH